LGSRVSASTRSAVIRENPRTIREHLRPRFFGSAVSRELKNFYGEVSVCLNAEGGGFAEAAEDCNKKWVAGLSATCQSQLLATAADDVLVSRLSKVQWPRSPDEIKPAEEPYLSSPPRSSAPSAVPSRLELSDSKMLASPPRSVPRVFPGGPSDAVHHRQIRSYLYVDDLVVRDASTISSAAATAATARSTSRSSVCQLETEMRMHRLPFQVTPPKNASPTARIC